MTDDKRLLWLVTSNQVTSDVFGLCDFQQLKQRICNSTSNYTKEIKMLIQETEQVIIAVRLYDNKTYGTTYGKGKYRRAIYNGTIEAKAAQATYLVDFYNFEDWANSAKTDAQMELLANVEPDSDTLYSWIKHYDRSSQEKVLV